MAEAAKVLEVEGQGAKEHILQGGIRIIYYSNVKAPPLAALCCSPP